ncbi:hypothetical protein PR202_ga00243 [Eleusine coracana subsp. coracana]|uniref:Uncharacterized protein n=1 Tax=Eleusine coracana subsp. coracana TaxID=191504 RepID=A0AAV5BG11_ELECO|nr:hypothetical protein PR202_ga00243 [Eleusine coracana subsp. coracana]
MASVVGVEWWWMLAAAALSWWLFDAAVRFAWRPRALSRHLRAQGLRGPARSSLFHGNLGDVKRLRAAGRRRHAGRRRPRLHAHRAAAVPGMDPALRTGRVFVYWFGATPDVCVADLGVAKQVLADRTGQFPKHRINANLMRLLGEGLVMANGHDWQRHKRVVHPAFNIDKLKMMTATMAACALAMVSGWEARLAAEQGKGKRQVVEIELSAQFEELTADVISHTAFGSRYREGKQVFEALKELQFITFSTLFDVQIPMSRHLPTRKKPAGVEAGQGGAGHADAGSSTRGWRQKDKEGYGNDLLGLMLEASGTWRHPGAEHGREIVDVQDLLSSSPETLRPLARALLTGPPGFLGCMLCSARTRTGRRGSGTRWSGSAAAAGLPRTTCSTSSRWQMNLFLLETLRLYSPVPLIRRWTRTPVQLGDITVPEDTLVTIPIATIHRDRESGATTPASSGPRGSTAAAARASARCWPSPWALTGVIEAEG